MTDAEIAVMHAEDSQQEIDRLKAELAQAKAENARLRKDVPTADALVWRDRANQLERENARLESENAQLRAALINLEPNGGNLPTMHACERCGMPGAVLHCPGGYLCPNGCNTNPLNLEEEKKDVYE